MKKQQKEEIHTKILEEIRKTKNSIEEYKELTKPISPENSIGRVSRMDAINNKSVNEAAMRLAEQKLSMLTIALSRIKDNNFGICAKCQNEIPIGRILIRPQSRFCIHCAS
jgi:DnaK suppressor protein